MANTTSQTRELKFVAQFTDGDTRTITLKDAKTDTTTQEILDLQTLILNGGTSTLLVSDKSGMPFNGFLKVSRVTKRTTNLDIN